MLSLSAGNMQSLSVRGRNSFDGELVVHCRTYAPELSRIAGEAAMRQLVASWTARASAHGLTLRGPTRLFAELALTFGSSFDTDPQLAWAAQFLADHDSDEMTRARSLFTASHEFLMDTAGPDDAYSWQALRQVRQMVGLPPGNPGEALEARILGALHQVHPNKARIVGDAALLRLVERARLTCRQHRLAGDPPVLLLTGMMFGFGHGIAQDPLYPWVARTLARTPAPAGDVRATQLARKVMIYIDHMLARLAPKSANAVDDDWLADLSGERDT